MDKPVTIRMAPWVLTAICAAAVAFVAMSSYFFFYGTSYLMRYFGTAIAGFAIAAAADAIASKIVLDGDTMRINSLMRRRSFPRSDFVAVQLNGGAVVLKRREGGWLILPGTGNNASWMRDLLDAWLKRPA